MPDPKKKVVFFEGDDDKAFLEALQEAKLLPEGWQLANRNKQQHPGKDGLVRQLLPVVSPVNGIDGRAVVLVDLDDLSPTERVAWFRSAIDEALRNEPKYAGVVLESSGARGRVQGFRLISGDRVGHVAVVPVGHPDDADLNEQYGIDRFAIDDWVLRLALNQRVFQNVGDLSCIRFDVAVKKYREVGALFRENGLEVRKAKTYVQILRAIAAIGPSTATIVGRLVKKGLEALGTQEFTALTKPFLDDLAVADELVSA
ncbi:MAG TPA: hypothetical protein VND64_11670 [Pirellulales bacterium]|nr:hypothetical protein [Pirellulales bacterium]